MLGGKESMIHLIHTIAKIGMAIWSLICGFMVVVDIMTIPKMAHDPNTSAGTGAAFVVALVFIGALWFFPMLGLIIAAYFTRPQAWADKGKE